MYADRVEVESRRSVKERLNVNFGNTTGQRRVTGKRQRRDDKWEHDLFEDNAPRVSSQNVDGRDLRSKLQRKGLQPASKGGRTSVSGVHDLRQKLSGTMTTQPVNADPPKANVEITEQSNKQTGLEALTTLVKKARSQVPQSKAAQKAGTTVDGFLQSLGLEKYRITFQAEEVDMTALMHMTDDDLKAIGVPMGPRKKILLALESRRA